MSTRGGSSADALEPLGSQLRKVAPETVDEFVQEARKQRNRDEAAVAALGSAYAGAYQEGPKAGSKDDLGGHRSENACQSSLRGGGAARISRSTTWYHSGQHGRGYSFLEDCNFLRAGLVEYLDTLADFSIDDDAKVVGYLTNLTASHLRPALQEGVSAMSLVVRFMAMLDGEIAESMLTQRHWSAAARFEGNSLVSREAPRSTTDSSSFPREWLTSIATDRAAGGASDRRRQV